MAKKAYCGIDAKARATKKLYVGVNGVARKIKIKKAYVGIDGKARLFFSGNTTYFGSILQAQSSTTSTTKAFNRRDLSSGALLETVAVPLTQMYSGPLLCGDRFYIGVGKVSLKAQAVTTDPNTFSVISTFENTYTAYDLPFRCLVGNGTNIVGGMSAIAYYVRKTDVLTGADIGQMGQFYYPGCVAQPVSKGTFTFASRTYNSTSSDEYNTSGREFDFNTGAIARTFSVSVSFSDSPRNIFGTLNNVIYTYFSYWNSGWYTWDYSTLAKLTETQFTRDVKYAYEGHIVSE